MTTQNDAAEPSLASGGSAANDQAEVLAKGIADIIRVASEPDWISVTERPPERNELVCVVWNGRVTVGTYSPMLEDWWVMVEHSVGLTPVSGVTVWMPLPAPPLPPPPPGPMWRYE